MTEAVTPWIHIVGATIWVGPQFLMVSAAVPAVRTIGDLKVRARAMRVLTTRFGYLAWAGMALLLFTGIGNLFEEEESLGELFDLNYGVIFIVKMALVATAAALAALHTFTVGPRLLDLQESAADEAEIAAPRRLSIMVSTASLLVAIVIVFCAALLGTDFARE